MKQNRKEKKTKIKRFLSALLVFCLIAASVPLNMMPAMAATSATSTGYQDALVKNLRDQVEVYMKTHTVTQTIDYLGFLDDHFKIGQTLKSGTSDGFSGHCWNHTRELAMVLFDTDIPGGTGKYYLTGSCGGWDQVGQVVNASDADVWALLLKSQPGDLVQYSNSYTNYPGTPSHTAMIYSNDGNTVKTYNCSSCKISLFTVTSSTVSSSLGSFKGTTYGMTIYRSKNAPLPGPYNEQIIAYNKTENTSNAGYYYLTTNQASINDIPAESGKLVRSITKGEVIKILSSGQNAYNNTWYKTTDGYIFPKTNTGAVRLTKISSPFYFEPTNISAISETKSDRDYVCSTVRLNGSYTLADTKNCGCIIYEKNSSGYTEVARATDTGNVDKSGWSYYNISQSPLSTNTKFYAKGTSNVFSFVPGKTYYYRFFVGYGSSGAVAYSYNYAASSDYYSFVAPSATGITAKYSDMKISNVTSVSASLAYKCTLTGATISKISDVYVYLYSSGTSDLGEIYHKTVSFGGSSSYYNETVSLSSSLIKPETSYKVRVAIKINGNIYYSDYIAFTTGVCTHSFGSWTVDIQPSCTGNGQYKRVCSICGATEYDDIEPLYHSFGSWTTTVQAKCGVAGTEERACTRCGYKETRNTDPLVHNYTTQIVQPTCLDKGYTIHTCTYCSNSYIDNYVDALDHSFGSWTTKTAATCGAAGTEERTCTRCGYKVTRNTDPLVHNYIAQTVAPTCLDQGYTLYTCANCSNSYKDNYVDALHHSFGSWTTKTAPTCGAAGTEERTCTRCGYKETRNTDPLDHSFVTNVVAPTCLEKGYTVYTCTECGYSYNADVTDAHGHKYSSSVTAPKPGVQGYTTYTCVVCGDTYKDNYTDYVDDNSVKIVIENKNVAPGSTFTVTVKTEGNTGFSFLSVSPAFADVLKLEKVENGDMSSDFTKGKQYIWTSDENITKDGTLMTFTFSVAEDIPAGEYEVGLVLRECYDNDENSVSMSVIQGTVEVTDCVYGDANGDGKVDGTDVVRLKKYLANYDYDTNTSTVEIAAGADANGDGKVDGTDVVRLKKYLANYDYESGTSTVVLGPAK